MSLASVLIHYIAEVLLFILIALPFKILSSSQNALFSRSIDFWKHFHSLQCGHPSDTDKQQIQGHFSNCISFLINDIYVLERENCRKVPSLVKTEGAEGR